MIPSLRRTARIAFTSAVLATGVLSLAACDSDAEDAVEDVGDAIGDAVDDVGDAVDDAIDR